MPRPRFSRGRFAVALAAWAAWAAAALAAPSARAVEVERLWRAAASGGAGAFVEAARGVAFVRPAAGREAELSAALSAAGGGLGEPLAGDWRLASLPAGMSVARGLDWLRGLPGVLDAHHDAVHRPSRTPNDPLLASQYALGQIRAAAAWDYETGASTRVTIAIVDTGIDGTHADLSGKLSATTSRAFDPTSGAASVNNPPTAACNHGTRVAGIAAASTDNGTQVSGVSWDAQLVSYKVFRDGDCSGDCSQSGCTTDDAGVIAAINRAVTEHNSSRASYGRMIVNMSLGGAQACSASLQTAVTSAVNAGLILVAAAGNDGGAVNSPGNCSGVIPVAATDSSGNIASFSSRGAEVASGGLAAPGVAVLTTDSGGGTASATGTSFSAPHVAGAAALLVAAQLPASTSAATDLVRSTLRSAADPVGLGAAGFKAAGNSAGAGRLNLFLALQLAKTGRLADFQGADKAVAFPNPFRADRHEAVTFALPSSLSGATDVKIRVYTLDGQLVRDLSSLTWNARNDRGAAVASGTYAFVVTSSKGSRSGRVSVLR